VVSVVGVFEKEAIPLLAKEARSRARGLLVFVEIALGVRPNLALEARLTHQKGRERNWPPAALAFHVRSTGVPSPPDPSNLIPGYFPVSPNPALLSNAVVVQHYRPGFREKERSQDRQRYKDPIPATALVDRHGKDKNRKSGKSSQDYPKQDPHAWSDEEFQSRAVLSGLVFLRGPPEPQEQTHEQNDGRGAHEQAQERRHNFHFSQTFAGEGARATQAT
jgi:hypothetical protein